ncbi:DUF4873 domain-containing protein [uncultured Jatrophihabitans sp.]|uniref:DUF4873 domain-containing protein n=1 Tax=uncultured Jatrophihabitans sp. TaxID=1610747 RepID=UPI0035CA3504
MDEADSVGDNVVVPFPAPGVDAEPDDDGYDGPAQLIHADGETQVRVTLRGHFDPISGRYSWYGRVAAAPEVAELVAGGARTVRLRTPHAEVETKLSDIDPWGRPRVEGFGAAPFAVLDTVPDDTA